MQQGMINVQGFAIPQGGIPLLPPAPAPAPVQPQTQEPPRPRKKKKAGSLFHSEYKKKLNKNFTLHSGDVVAHVRKHDGRHIGYSHSHRGGFLSFLIDAGINIGSAIGDAARGDPMEFGRYAIPKV